MLSRLNCLAWLASTAIWALPLGVHAAGDPLLGQKKFYTCYGCHGIENYKNAYPNYSVPKLRHQQAAYVVAALKEYRSGERPHATMHAQAASLSDQDIDDIAAYLQGGEAASPRVVASESSGAAAALPPKQVAACIACHGENGLGVALPLTPKPAVLAGQHADYLEEALTAYRNGRRKNLVMDGMAKLLGTEDDVKIAAAYFAAQPSALVTAKSDSQ